MLKIRLQMTGRRNDRHFRIIVTEGSSGPRSGKYVEKIGFINPRTKELQIDTDRAKYWLSVGAQASDRVYNILVDKGVVDGPKRNVLPKKTPIEPEQSDGDTTENNSETENSDSTKDTDTTNTTDEAENKNEPEEAEEK